MMKLQASLIFVLLLATTACKKDSDSNDRNEGAIENPSQPQGLTLQTIKSGPIDFTVPEVFSRNMKTDLLQDEYTVAGYDVDLTTDGKTQTFAMLSGLQFAKCAGKKEADTFVTGLIPFINRDENIPEKISFDTTTLQSWPAEASNFKGSALVREQYNEKLGSIYRMDVLVIKSGEIDGDDQCVKFDITLRAKSESSIAFLKESAEVKALNAEIQKTLKSIGIDRK